MLVLARGQAHCRWEGLGQRLGRGVDQVEAERLLWAALDAGLVVIRERQGRRGDWEPYQWALTPAGEALLVEAVEIPDIAGYLAGEDAPHPVLESIRAWLSAGGGNTVATRLVLAIGEELRQGRLPLDRMLSMRVAGRSKAVRVDDHRDELEGALGFPLEQVVRRAGRAALVAGPLRFRVGEFTIDARGVPPWLALPPETVGCMTDLHLEADRLLTIENLVPFEREARAGLPAGTIALYLGGFPGELERTMLGRFVATGVRRIDHWGDLDLGGLRILRHVQSLVTIEVSPFRMEPELLSRMPTLPLTASDREGLAAWSGPGELLARRMLETGRKAEQEGWGWRG